MDALEGFVVALYAEVFNTVISLINKLVNISIIYNSYNIINICMRLIIYIILTYINIL